MLTLAQMQISSVVAPRRGPPPFHLGGGQPILFRSISDFCSIYFCGIWVSTACTPSKFRARPNPPGWTAGGYRGPGGAKRPAWGGIRWTPPPMFPDLPISRLVSEMLDVCPYYVFEFARFFGCLPRCFILGDQGGERVIKTSLGCFGGCSLARRAIRGAGTSP